MARRPLCPKAVIQDHHEFGTVHCPSTSFLGTWCWWGPENILLSLSSNDTCDRDSLALSSFCCSPCFHHQFVSSWDMIRFCYMCAASQSSASGGLDIGSSAPVPSPESSSAVTLHHRQFTICGIKSEAITIIRIATIPPPSVNFVDARHLSRHRPPATANSKSETYTVNSTLSRRAIFPPDASPPSLWCWQPTLEFKLLSALPIVLSPLSSVFSFCPRRRGAAAKRGRRGAKFP